MPASCKCGSLFRAAPPARCRTNRPTNRPTTTTTTTTTCPPLQVKASHPRTPLTLYANGSGGLLERMAGTGADVIGLDWTVDMADARRRLGPNQAVQVGCGRSGQAVGQGRLARQLLWPARGGG